VRLDRARMENKMSIELQILNSNNIEKFQELIAVFEMKKFKQ
jgi:hypothetical protein